MYMHWLRHVTSQLLAHSVFTYLCLHPTQIGVTLSSFYTMKRVTQSLSRALSAVVQHYFQVTINGCVDSCILYHFCLCVCLHMLCRYIFSLSSCICRISNTCSNFILSPLHCILFMLFHSMLLVLLLPHQDPRLCDSLLEVSAEAKKLLRLVEKRPYAMYVYS